MKAVKDVIELMFLDGCPYKIGEQVSAPLSESRRSYIGFPGVGKIIEVREEKPRVPGMSVRYRVKLEVTLPDRV